MLGNEYRERDLCRRHLVDFAASSNKHIDAAIGVRDGGAGGAGGAAAPPIRAVCRHEFGQRIDIIRAKHITCLNNTNLGSVSSVTGVNGEKTRI